MLTNNVMALSGNHLTAKYCIKFLYWNLESMDTQNRTISNEQQSLS